MLWLKQRDWHWLLRQNCEMVFWRSAHIRDTSEFYIRGLIESGRRMLLVLKRSEIVETLILVENVFHNISPVAAISNFLIPDLEHKCRVLKQYAVSKDHKFSSRGWIENIIKYECEIHISMDKSSSNLLVSDNIPLLPVWQTSGISFWN